MDSLEDIDLARSLNFSNSLHFLEIVEEELASLVLAARSAAAAATPSDPGAAPGSAALPAPVCRLAFPPLKPRYATLLQVTAARFGLKATLRGWGDDRQVLVDARLGAHLPCIQCTDFRPLGEGPLATRLVDKAKPAIKHPAPAPPNLGAKAAQAAAGSEKEAMPAAPKEAAATNGEMRRGAGAEGRGGMRGWADDEGEDNWLAERRRGGAASVKAAASTAPSPDNGARDAAGGGGAGERRTRVEAAEGRGMHGWGDDDGEDSWLAKRRRASASASAAGGRAPRGRGFSAAAGAEAGNAADAEDEVVEYVLQQDYSKYAIDPDDNFSPHRKPWVELAGAWEFSGAWSFEPDQNENWEAVGGKDDVRGTRGVAVFRVEHAKGGDLSLALFCGNPGDARQWLEGRRGRGEEPFILEFRLDAEKQSWDYRFGRTSKRQAWRSLPWSNAHRTSFWVASLPGEDGKQHLLAGLDEFPERRFFFAKVLFRPTGVAFGPPAEASRRAGAFYVRDVAVFGRASLLPPPFASRDHFVELAGKSREEVLKMVEERDLASKVAAVVQGPNGGATVLICRSAADAAQVAQQLEGAIGVSSSQWAWPPSGLSSDGITAAREAQERAREVWARLHTETTRELAIFEEHLHRRTKHLEGIRIARASATRTILGNLRGPAPLPKPPEAGV